MRTRKGTFLIILITAVVTAIITNAVKDILNFTETASLSPKISAVVNIIKNKCIYDVDYEKMTDYALIGITAATNDPYTAYYGKTDFAVYRDDIASSYVGIGATIGPDTETGCIRIIATMENSPSEQAGIKSGDIIKAIDGTPYTSVQLSEAATYLKKGDEGTEVTVRIERDGEERDITLARAKIIKKNVKSKMLENNSGYIRINEFDMGVAGESKDTYEEFCEHLSALKMAGMTSLILDLRDNPGGDFDIVCKIADKLLPEALITYTEDKEGKREDKKSDADGIDVPMAVLINGGSASASEILTGALKDNEKATVIGTKSYGKGIVQSVYGFTDGSGLSVTTARYYTPKGVCIHGIGIEPDIEVQLDSKKSISDMTIEEDTQLKKALETLSR